VALELDFTDLKSGAVYPHAYAKVTEAHLTLSTDYVDATVAVYYSAEMSVAGKEPVFVFPTFTLSVDEVVAVDLPFVQALAALVQAGQIQSPKDALTACLYVLLKRRPELAGAVDI
jgi:hypothetical protein